MFMMRPLMWLLVCHGLLAQTPQKDPATLARMEGRTFNAVTGEPLRKTEIMLHGGYEYSVVSDSNGHWVIERIEPGSYNLTAQHQNFSLLNYGATRSDSVGTRMALSAGQNVTGLEL